MSYLVLLNQTTVPVNGETPVAAFLIDVLNTTGPAQIELSRSTLGDTGVRFSVGIAWAISSTPDVVALDGGVAAVINLVIE